MNRAECRELARLSAIERQLSASIEMIEIRRLVQAGKCAEATVRAEAAFESTGVFTDREADLALAYIEQFEARRAP